MTLGVLAILQAVSAAPKQMADVAYLLGDWSGSASGASVSLDVSKGPGNRSLKFELRVSGSLIRTFTDEGFLWWDGQAAAYRSHAMSSVSNEPRREIGRISSGALVMVSEPFEVAGVSERTRRTFSRESDGLRLKLDLRNGDAWKSGFSVLLKRRK